MSLYIHLKLFKHFLLIKSSIYSKQVCGICNGIWSFIGTSNFHGAAYPRVGTDRCSTLFVWRQRPSRLYSNVFDQRIQNV